MLISKTLNLHPLNPQNRMTKDEKNLAVFKGLKCLKSVKKYKKNT